MIFVDLYIAAGPFHLFNCINLKLHEYATQAGELCVVERFSGASQMAENTRRACIFSNVYAMSMESYTQKDYVDRSVSGRLSWEIRDLLYGTQQSKYRDMPFYGKRYERIFMAGRLDAFSTFLNQQVVRFGAKIFYFDDGLGARTFHFVSNSIAYRVRDRLGLNWQQKYLQGKYFYSPQLVFTNYPYPLFEQQKPSNEQAYLERMRDVFSYDPAKDPLRRAHMVYLHGGYELYPTLSQYDAKDCALARHIQDAFADACVLRHPVSYAAIGGPRTFSGLPFPFEACCLFNDMENRVLISGISAALFNPKFVFDSEPYVILTYKLLGPHALATFFRTTPERAEKMIAHMLTNAYRDKDKILIPETEEELMQHLETLSKRLAAK